MQYERVVVRDGRLAIVRVEGQLDESMTRPFENALLGDSDSDANCVIVDLDDVTYVQSAAVGILLKAHLALERLGGDIAIVCGSTDVGRLLSQLCIDRLLAVFDDVEGAERFLAPLMDEPDC